MDEFDYPKDKITEFLHMFLLNRYDLNFNTQVGHNENYSLVLHKDGGYEERKKYYNYYSYCYLLDAWLSELSSTKNISRNWKNLFIINKSYCNHPLDPFIYYNPEDILIIPYYLKSLENINDDSSECTEYQDIKMISDDFED